VTGADGDPPYLQDKRDLYARITRKRGTLTHAVKVRAVFASRGQYVQMGRTTQHMYERSLTTLNCNKHHVIGCSLYGCVPTARVLEKHLPLGDTCVVGTVDLIRFDI
jgi:hypothetical protein